MRSIGLLLLLLLPLKFFGQINPADSTVQVIAYWDKAEKHTYALTYQKLKVTGNDTIVTQDIRYKADISIIESAATGYTVEWKYRDYSFGNTTGKQIEESGMGSAIKLFQNIPVRFTTDENGTFKELLNWEEVRDKLKSSMDIAKNTLKLPEAFSALNEKLLTRADVEDIAIKDVQLFYMFYGQKLNLGVPIEEQVDSGNEITGPVKSDISLLLELIDFEESWYKVSYYQSYDEVAINKVMLPLVISMLSGIIKSSETEDVNKIKFKSFEDFYGSVLHDSGWPISTAYDRIVTLDNDEQAIERRTILLEE